MEAERNRVQGNRVISVWKTRTGTRMPRETYSIRWDANYTYPRTICVQYLRILFSCFGEEDFQSCALK